MGFLREHLVLVVDELSRTSHGRIATKAAAERLLLPLREEFVGRVIAETEPWAGTRISGSRWSNS